MFAELAAPVVEVLSGRRGAKEHFLRDVVVNRPAKRLLGVEVIVRQRGVLVVGRKMLRQRVSGNGLLRRLGQINIIGDILDVPAVIHPGEEELLGVAENDGADAAFFEPAVLLDNRNDPGRELRELSVELTHKLFTAREVEGSRNLLEDDPLPLAARQRDDVLPAMVGDEKSSSSFRGLLDSGM